MKNPIILLLSLAFSLAAAKKSKNLRTSDLSSFSGNGLISFLKRNLQLVELTSEDQPSVAPLIPQVPAISMSLGAEDSVGTFPSVSLGAKGEDSVGTFPSVSLGAEPSAGEDSVGTFPSVSLGAEPSGEDNVGAYIHSAIRITEDKKQVEEE